MLNCMKSFMFISHILALSFIALGPCQLEAFSRVRSQNYERGAWGGNGGWWGNSRSDWYGEYGTPEEYDYFGNYTTPHYSRHGYYNGYYSENQYPYHGVYYGDSVDGAALYFNIR